MFFEKHVILMQKGGTSKSVLEKRTWKVYLSSSLYVALSFKRDRFIGRMKNQFEISCEIV